MKTKYILLTIGVLAMGLSIYHIIQGQPFTDQILGLVCGSSLIYGYYELGKAEKT